MASELAAGGVADVIVVCDGSDRAAEYRRLLSDQRVDVRRYSRGTEVLDVAEIPERAVLIVDTVLGDTRGIDFVRNARDRGLENPVLMTVQQVSIPEAVEAIRFGATDILTMPLDAVKLRQAIKRLAVPEPEPIRSAMGAGI